MPSTHYVPIGNSCPYAAVLHGQPPAGDQIVVEAPLIPDEARRKAPVRDGSKLNVPCISEEPQGSIDEIVCDQHLSRRDAKGEMAQGGPYCCGIGGERQEKLITPWAGV